MYDNAKGVKMLEYLRNAAEKPLAKFFIVILAFSFIGWGVAEWIFGGSMRENNLMTVGGSKISLQQFNNVKSQEMATLSREQQRAVYADSVAMGAFNQNIIKKLTVQQMLDNRADDMGLVVSEHKIANEIKRMPEFQDRGVFSPYLFDSVLSNSGLNEESFAEYLRGQILRSMILGTISVPVAVPEFALDAAYEARYRERNIEYATFKFADVKVGEPSDEQLREYYVQNPVVIPETRNFSYVFVPAQMNKPDEYEIGYKKALSLEDDIIAGTSLKESAEKNKAKYVVYTGVSQGKNINDAVLTGALLSKVFTMDEGIESELLETKTGFIIIRVDKINFAHNAEFDKVKKSLINNWKIAQQRKQAYVNANEMLTSVNKGEKLTKAKKVKISRTNGAPVAVITNSFLADLNSNKLVEDTSSFYVVHVVDEVMPAVDKSKKEALRKELKTFSSQNVMDDYNSFLIRKYPTKMNDKIYKRFIEK